MRMVVTIKIVVVDGVNPRCLLLRELHKLKKKGKCVQLVTDSDGRMYRIIKEVARDTNVQVKHQFPGSFPDIVYMFIGRKTCSAVRSLRYYSLLTMRRRDRLKVFNCRL